jgi:transcriptional regulator with XRE-family HTH domain
LGTAASRRSCRSFPGGPAIAPPPGGIPIEEGGSTETTYARRVGSRLRAIRRQQGLSLHDVESVSRQEFKASVLGAYERGERIVSVARLQRLAVLYRVPVDQLLPVADGEEAIEVAASHESEAPAPPASPVKVTFDLARLADVDDPQLDMVHRYLDQIALRRQDFNGRMLTIRGEDVRAMAGFFGMELNDLLRRLDSLQLRVRP